MLVILTDKQVLSTRQICQGCLMADHSGLPRWRQGKLSCGRALRQSGENKPTLYQCQMGFQVANIE